MSLLEWLKFWSKFYRIPLFWNTVSEYPPPPNENCQRSWHFDFSVSEYPPPPENWNLGRSWHFDFSVSEYPPPENWNLGRSWHFDFSVSEYPPPENWNLGRSWHFDFSVSEYSPPPWKLKFRQILALWLFSFRIPPPPPENLNFVTSWHFKIFQCQNNWYQWQTMCGNLPHVETLSSPDNYSFFLCCKEETHGETLCQWKVSPLRTLFRDKKLQCKSVPVNRDIDWRNFQYLGGHK